MLVAGCTNVAPHEGTASQPDMAMAPGGSSGGSTTGGTTAGPSTTGGTTGGSTSGSGGGGSVGPSGGSVTLLHFGLTGDTRPGACEDTAGYPTAVINTIADQFEKLGVDFALDLGDHMYVCNNNLTTATDQMDLYMQATQRLKATWFMTEGNHECYGGQCLAGSQNANYVVFMKALAPIASTPYYSFNIQTSLGLATFVIVADNSWDATQSAWLDKTLTTADTAAKYTIVARHHPEGDTSVSTNAASMQIIRSHKFALFLTGHSHEYRHMTTDQGRDIVLGTGGAPLLATGAFHGYAIIDQQADSQLKVSVCDVSGTQQDVWSVGPNQ
jgi:hypothetical protein